MTSTFYGLEETYLLPPNIHLTGPNIKDDNADHNRALQEKDPKIYEWLQDALEKNQKVIYLTIGSECYYVDWSIKAVKEGLIMLN